MNEPLKIMDEIERHAERSVQGYTLMLGLDDLQSLRTALEAQAEELAQAKARLETTQGKLNEAHAAMSDLTVDAALMVQKDARIARLEGAISAHRDSCAPECTATEDKMLWSVLGEWPREWVIPKIKAEALRELDPPALVGHLEVKEWLEKEADRIEREAKEES